jgi:murein DD-endopeptidase MepM/ murein hydrolase activator NlpD
LGQLSAERTVDRWRHAPIGRSRGVRPATREHGLPPVYRGRARKSLPHIYDSDHIELRRGGRFRWLLSTCLAATVGAVAIAVALFGLLDSLETREGVLPALRNIREARPPAPALGPRTADGLRWAAAKGDLLPIGTGAFSTKHIIHEQVQVRRDNRPFIQIRPYMRLAARLAPVPVADTDVIPPFNPFRLYANPSPSPAGEEDIGTADGRSDVSIRVVELLGGILPEEDGQELETQEVAELVASAEENDPEAALRRGLQPDAADPLMPTEMAGEKSGVERPETVPPNTTVLAKSAGDVIEEDDDLERKEIKVVRVARGDTVAKILQRLGAEGWQARTMAEAAKGIFPDSALSPTHEVHVTLVPSLTRADRMEPARFSVFADGQDHKVTVTRNAAGEFVASAVPFDANIARAALGDSDQAQSASLYASIYHAALMHGIPTETILQFLRVHAYETDFRRRTRNGDSIDLFFDLKEEAGAESTPGELLYTSIVSGGEMQRFWRFRTPDGVVDYYDESGNNARKFLMRRPVRGESVRLTSGFGMRLHPVLTVARMHTGVDWSAPIGTPILAAGNGIIEESDRKGQYGNYVRVRHANGYQTAYGHLSRFGPNIRDGAKVRQGQVIGFVGCTGLCSGPHLHYEVLVNSRFVDPLQIQVPRERHLAGKQLMDFHKERVRIDELMHRTPVMTASR